MVTCCNHMVVLVILIVCMSSGEEFDWMDQEKTTEQGYQLVLSENSNDRLKGIKLLTENKTHAGLRKLVICWINEKEMDVLDEVVKAIQSHEEFQYSNAFVEWIEEQIDINSCDEKSLLKFKHLFEKSKADRAKFLIEEIRKKQSEHDNRKMR